MIKFIDVTGKTEDEAIQSALAQLKMDRDGVSVEILAVLLLSRSPFSSVRAVLLRESVKLAVTVHGSISHRSKSLHVVFDIVFATKKLLGHSFTKDFIEEIIHLSLIHI